MSIGAIKSIATEMTRRRQCFVMLLAVMILGSSSALAANEVSTGENNHRMFSDFKNKQCKVLTEKSEIVPLDVDALNTWFEATSRSMRLDPIGIVPLTPPNIFYKLPLQFLAANSLECWNMEGINRHLNEEFPEITPRIHYLLGWFGSGAGSWVNYPAYEKVPKVFLCLLPWKNVIEVIESSSLPPREMEGAARLIATIDEPLFVSMLSQETGSRLLRYVTGSHDATKLQLIEHALKEGKDYKTRAQDQTRGYVQ